MTRTALTRSRSSNSRTALKGAALAAFACLLFWATAAANALPEGAPDFVRSFTPAHGVQRLALGLLLSMLVGGGLAALLAAIVTRYGRDHDSQLPAA
jgi:hypothetical protein